MKKQYFMLICSALLFSATSASLADTTYYTGVAAGGYPEPQSEPVPPPVVYLESHHHHYHPEAALQWLNSGVGEPLPMGMVVGGVEPHPPHKLYICRGEFRDGVHPGKLVAGYCNITWDGQEIRLSNYQVLVSRIPLGWTETAYGRIPMNAVAGGYEESGPLYICKAYYHGGYHPGQVVDGNCNFAWGGREIIRSHYQVLLAM